METYEHKSPKSTEKDEYLTNEEAASLCRVSERQWLRIRQLAQIEVLYVGSHPRFRRSDVVAAIEHGRMSQSRDEQQSMARAAASVTARDSLTR